MRWAIIGSFPSVTKVFTRPNGSNCWKKWLCYRDSTLLGQHNLRVVTVLISRMKTTNITPIRAHPLPTLGVGPRLTHPYPGVWQSSDEANINWDVIWNMNCKQITDTRGEREPYTDDHRTCRRSQEAKGSPRVHWRSQNIGGAKNQFIHIRLSVTTEFVGKNIGFVLVM